MQLDTTETAVEKETSVEAGIEAAETEVEKETSMEAGIEATVIGAIRV